MGIPSWCRAALRLWAVVITVAVVVPVASGIGAVSQTSTVDTKLVGTWTRKVTSADVKRTGGYGIPAGTVCKLTIKKSGAAHLACTNIGDFDGTIVPAGTNRVHINLGLSNPDVYRWRVSGRLLTFTKLQDVVGDRAAVMWGVWKRK